MTDGKSAVSLGYAQLVRRDFLRNRLAVAALLGIVLVTLVAVFCPLIANNRPLYIRAVFQADFDNALQISIEQIGKLENAGKLEPQERDKAVQLVEENLRAMEEHLSGPDRTVLKSAELKFREGHGKNDAAAIREAAAQLDPLFDAKPQAVARYPAVRGLSWGEVYTMLLTIWLPIHILINRWMRRRWQSLLVLLVIPLLGTWAWKQIYPTVQDGRPYREIIESPDFAKAGGKLVTTPIPYGENENILADSRQQPTWMLPPGQRVNWHWLGTDTNGRDVLARMVYGARVSMLVGIVAVAIYTLIGIALGAAAGYFGGLTDIALSRFTEVVICFPPLMVILSVQAFLKPSILNIILTLAALWWTGVARLQRGEFLRLVNLDFVQAVRALGGSSIRIITLHVLPNAIGPVLVMTSFGIAGSILIESGLSFLGFGVPQPMASWGDLLNNGRNDIKGTWWLTVFPGLTIFFTVTCFNLIGEAIRDALDPRRT